MERREARLGKVAVVRLPAEMERAVREIADQEYDTISGVIRRMVGAQLAARRATKKIAV